MLQDKGEFRLNSVSALGTRAARSSLESAKSKSAAADKTAFSDSLSGSGQLLSPFKTLNFWRENEACAAIGINLDSDLKDTRRCVPV